MARGWIIGFLLVAPTAAIEISGITKCQAGKEDLVGVTKAYTVQVCNLFGATCYVNQVETASADCATQALKVDHQTCALFPILTYKDNDRTNAAKQQVGSTGCSVSCSGTGCSGLLFSGGCVSVQCSLGGDPLTYAGPAMTKTGSGSGRTTGVTDTAAAGAFEVHDFTSIPSVGAMKTVFLSRTGNYVASFSRGGSASGTVDYKYGKVPTVGGNNYGPKACPSSSTLMSAATTITKEELRMCGSTGKWVYFAAVNLVMDTSMYAQYSKNSVTGVGATKKNIRSVAFLNGESNYESSANMDDQRKVYLYSGSSATGTPLLSSATITPAKSSGMTGQVIAGTWRTYGVVFYCTDYDRVDLTTCAADKQAMFYVGDPDPTPSFGATAGSISGGSGPGAAASGTARVAAGLAAATTLVMWHTLVM